MSTLHESLQELLSVKKQLGAVEQYMDRFDRRDREVLEEMTDVLRDIRFLLQLGMEGNVGDSRHFERFEVVAVRTYERFQVAYLGRWGWENDVDLDALTDEQYTRIRERQYGDMQLEATTRDNYVRSGSAHLGSAELIPVKFEGHDAWPVGTVVEFRATVVGEKGEVLDMIRANEDNIQKV